MQSKKAKRGSAFAVNTKKKGTQYSQSQELSSARNVQ
jgi:tRNA(Ser,Leu) C12 N-acetylase TAN1